MFPDFNDIVNPLKGLTKTIAEDKEYFAHIALCYKEMLRALLEHGFSREEAIAIITNRGFGTPTANN